MRRLAAHLTRVRRATNNQLLAAVTRSREALATPPVVPMNPDSFVQSASVPSIGALAAKHIDLAFRSVVPGRSADRTDDYIRYVTGEAHPMANLAIIGAGLDVANVLQAIAPLTEGALPSAVLFPHDMGEGVEAALAGKGYQNAGLMPAMAVDIASMGPTSLPAGYSFHRVAADESDAWTSAFSIGYGLPEKVSRLFSPEATNADLSPDAQAQFFAVKRDGKIVATSVLCLGEGLAGVYCVATLPEERKKGLGAHATAAAALAAQPLGYKVAILQSSEEGHNVYLKLGFKDVGSVPMFIRLPG